MFWVLRTGASWRDLPPDYEEWGSVHRRFIHWRRKDIRERVLEILIDEPDYEWLMIDANYIKVHLQAAWVKGSNQDMSRTKEGSTSKYIWPWMRMVCQCEFVTGGTRADCKEAVHLIEGISAETLLVDQSYETNGPMRFWQEWNLWSCRTRIHHSVLDLILNFNKE